MSVARMVALLLADVRALLRDRAGVAALLIAFVAIGAMAPGGLALAARFAEDDEVAGPDPTWDCQPGAMAPVALVGEAPAWLAWPDPFVPAESADVLLRAGDGRVEVVELHEGARPDPVRDCVRSRAREERRERLDALGISESPGSVVAVRTLPPAPADAQGRLRATPLALALVSAAFVVLFSVFLELGPRARASGWLESFLALPGARGDLVLAWWVVGVGSTALGLGGVLVGDAIAAPLLGVSTGPVPWSLLGPIAVVISAVGVRAFVDVPDFRTALVQAVPAGLVVAALIGVAALAESREPGLGGLVPVGGLLLATLSGTEAHGLAVATSVAAAAALLWDAERSLSRLIVRAGAMGSTAARRARGDYVPEAALLMLIAVAGVGAWAPPAMLLSDPVARAGLTLVLFLGLPALVAPTPLGLDRRALLSWRAPPVRAWLLAPVVLVGLLAMGLEVFTLASRLFPDRVFMRQLVEALGELDTPAGHLVISVAPGLCEELLFRGAVLGLLRKRLPTWAAVLGQAAGFALLHGLAVRVPHTFALGVALGALTVRTGSIWPAIAIHTAHNYVAATLLGDPAAWTGSPVTAVAIVAGIAAVWASGRRV